MLDTCKDITVVAAPLASEWLIWVVLAVAHFYLVYESSLEMFAGWKKANQDGGEVWRNVNKLTILGAFIILVGFLFQLQSVHNQGALVFAGISYTQSLGWCQMVHGLIGHFIPFIFYSSLIHFWFLKLQTAFKNSAMAPDETFIRRYRMIFTSMIIIESATLIAVSLGHDCLREVRVIDAALFDRSSDRTGKWCYNRHLWTQLCYVIIGGGYLTFFNAWLTYEFWSKLSESAHRTTRMRSMSSGGEGSQFGADSSSRSRKLTISVAYPPTMDANDVANSHPAQKSPVSPMNQASPLSVPDFSSKPNASDFSLVPRLQMGIATSSSTESFLTTSPDESVKVASPLPNSNETSSAPQTPNRVRFDESVVNGRMERSLSKTALALDDDFFRLAQKNTLICLVAALSSAILLSIWSIGELSDTYLWLFTNLDVMLNSICVFCTLNCGRDWYPILFASCIRGLRTLNEFQIERELSQASRDRKEGSQTATDLESCKPDPNATPTI